MRVVRISCIHFRRRASLGVPGDAAYQTGMSTAPAPLADRIALVVGASRGIGYESALALAKAGAHVVATARTQGGLCLLYTSRCV